IGHHLDVVQVLDLGRAIVFGMQILDHLLDRDLITLGNFLEQLLGWRFGFFYFERAQQADIFDQPLIAWLNGSDMKRAILYFVWKDAVAFDEIGRQRAQGFRRNRDMRERRGSVTGRSPRPTVG